MRSKPGILALDIHLLEFPCFKMFVYIVDLRNGAFGWGENNGEWLFTFTLKKINPFCFNYGLSNGAFEWRENGGDGFLRLFSWKLGFQLWCVWMGIKGRWWFSPSAFLKT